MDNQIGTKGKKPKEKGKKTITPILHTSHVKTVEDLFDQLPKEDKKYRCPLCRLDKFKPTWPSKVKKHLQSHDHRIQIKGYNLKVLACHLDCRQKKKDKHAHYHCLCGKTLARKDGFDAHWTECSKQLLHVSDESIAESGIFSLESLDLEDCDIPDIDSLMFDDFETDNVPVIESDGLLELLGVNEELSISTQETGKPDITHLQVIAHPVEESEPDHHVPYSASMIKGKAEKVRYSQEQEQPHQVTQAHPTDCEQPDQFGKDKFDISFFGKLDLSNQFNSGNDSGNFEKVEAGMSVDMISRDLTNYFPSPKDGAELLAKIHSQDDFFDKSTPVGSCDDQYEDNVKTNPPDSPINDTDFGSKADLYSYTDFTPLDQYLHGCSTSMESDFSKLNEIEPMDTDVSALKIGNGFLCETNPSKHVEVTNDVQMEIC